MKVKYYECDICHKRIKFSFDRLFRYKVLRIRADNKWIKDKMDVCGVCMNRFYDFVRTESK